MQIRNIKFSGLCTEAVMKRHVYGLTISIRTVSHGNGVACHRRHGCRICLFVLLEENHGMLLDVDAVADAWGHGWPSSLRGLFMEMTISASNVDCISVYHALLEK